MPDSPPTASRSDLTADAEETTAGGANSVSSDNQNKTSRTTAAGTGGGTTTSPGINGSTVALPFGLDPARTPVMGNYTTDQKRQAHLTSQWYRLDLPAAQRDPAYKVLVVTAAGRIQSVNKDGVVTYGQQLRRGVRASRRRRRRDRARLTSCPWTSAARRPGGICGSRWTEFRPGPTPSGSSRWRTI